MHRADHEVMTPRADARGVAPPTESLPVLRLRKAIQVTASRIEASAAFTAGLVRAQAPRTLWAGCRVASPTSRLERRLDRHPRPFRAPLRGGFAPGSRRAALSAIFTIVRSSAARLMAGLRKIASAARRSSRKRTHFDPRL